jgi:hypothetical protein
MKRSHAKTIKMSTPVCVSWLTQATTRFTIGCVCTNAPSTLLLSSVFVNSPRDYSSPVRDGILTRSSYKFDISFSLASLCGFYFLPGYAWMFFLDFFEDGLFFMVVLISLSLLTGVVSPVWGSSSSKDLG